MDCPEKLFDEAERLEQQGAREAALAVWRLLAERFPGTEPLCRFALIAEELGEVEEAKRALRQALDIDPDLAPAYLKLGALAIDTGDYEDAEYLLRRALRIEETKSGFSMLGVALRHLGRTDEAAESYRKAIEIDPSFDEAYFNLGVILRETEPLTSIELFRKALDLDPECGPAHRELGWRLRWQDDMPEAEYHLRRAIELHPDDAWAHIYLGNLLWGLANTDAALAEYRWAQAAEPEWVFPVIAQANVYEQEENWEESEALYVRALKLEPDDAVANMNLGRMLQKKGESDRAKFFLQKAIALKSDYESARELLRHI